MARIAAFVGLALSAAAAGCWADREPGAILASGHVEATEVRVSTKVSGVLERLAVEEGDAVAAGQELAVLDTVDTRLALETARAERGQVEANLRLAVAGPRREEIGEAEAQVAQARADLDGAERDLARMQALLDRGSGTAKARDDARTRHDIASGRLEAAEERLLKLRAGTRREEIDAARARLAAAEAVIAQLDQRIRDATLVSPVAGVVTAKLAEQGELLAPGAGVVVVTDLGNAWLTVWVGEPDVGRIRIGQRAEVTTDDGQKRPGRVTFIASQAEFTPRNVQTRDERVKLVFRVKVGLDNTDGLFKPGMPAEARLPAASSSS